MIALNFPGARAPVPLPLRRRIVCVLAALSLLPVASVCLGGQEQVFLRDQLLGMTADVVQCPAGFHCEGSIIRNPASLDPQPVLSVIRNDGRSGFLMPANFWTMWPNGSAVANSGAAMAPFMSAADVLQKYIVPQRVLRMFPGAKVVSIQHEDQCPRMREPTDCAVAVLSFTSKEGRPMEASVEARCRYEQPSPSTQFNDVLFLITFAPQGQLQSAAPPQAPMQVDPNWHAREQARAIQFSREYQQRMQRENGNIVATGQAQVAAAHQWGDTVLAEDRRTQAAIDQSSQKFAAYIGDKTAVWRWRNTQTGNTIVTQSNQPPGPNWVPD